MDNQTRLPKDPTALLNFQLGQLGFIALDVECEGDCFFFSCIRLYLHIRQAAVQYPRDNPECFNESNIQNLWNGYLTNMPMQGTSYLQNDKIYKFISENLI